MKIKTHIVKIVLTSVMIALNIVLERFFTFHIESNHYSISIITVAFAAVYLGLPYAITVAALGDIIGALMFPIGAYFPGFTLTNVLTALCICLFIGKKVTVVRSITAVLINKAIGTLILNSIWVSVLYKGGIDAFPAYMVTRIPQAIIMLVIESIILIYIFHEESTVRELLNKSMQRALK